MSEQELWNELGNLYFLSGSYDQAANAYRRSIQLDASFGRPYSNLALTYVQQGKFEEAIDLYRSSIELLIERKEKAVSWNRLGTVYRHLKDYSKAVIAFQEADELDPQSDADFPVAASVHKDVTDAPSSILDTAVTAPAEAQPEPQPQPQIEWWDVDERRMDAAMHPEPVTVQDELPGESWTASDASQFQQDISQLPEAVSPTSWGEAELEDEFEADAESAIDFPVADDDLSAWLPLPEEEPWSDDRLQVPPFFEDISPEPPDPPVEWNSVSTFHVMDAMDFTPLVTSTGDSQVIFGAGDSGSLPQRSTVAEQTWETHQVDVALEERPAPEYALPVCELTEPVAEPEPIVPQAEAVPTPEEGPDASAMERDDEEMHEIELGIEKFKRVVQLNPRNGHAWDALGTLYKSAGLYKEAILAYQQAISNDPARSLYYHHLGLVYACEGRDEDAIGAFQRVIEIDPDYSLAHATLGGYYRKMGLEELAQKHIGKAMKNIFDSENEYNRACLEAICGNADQAIALLSVALKNKQTYVDWILRDPDLDFIRQDPRFKQLISDYTR